MRQSQFIHFRTKKEGIGTIAIKILTRTECITIVDGDQWSYYNTQIGILQWMVELGQIDITTEVSCLATFLAMPCCGHLNAVFHMYPYLKAHSHSHLAFDLTPIDYSQEEYVEHDWEPFYGLMKEP